MEDSMQHAVVLDKIVISSADFKFRICLVRQRDERKYKSQLGQVG